MRAPRPALTTASIEEAEAQIAADFVAQCQRGAQTQQLPETQAACGRVLRDSGNSQRGLYGTAAALRVLAADGRREARDLVPRLCEFLDAYIRSGSLVSEGKAAVDRANVLKLSEVLFALYFVPVAIWDTGGLARYIASTLMDARVADTGWGYFIGDQAPEALPTAMAYRALMRHGYDIPGARSYLENAVGAQTAAEHDIFVQVACTYVLSVSAPDRPKKDAKAIRNSLRGPHDRQWRVLAPLLRSDLEANVEYSYNGEYYYVRVPWQLYLVGCAHQLRATRNFASVGVQRRLETAVTDVTKGSGFSYPHSGDQVSARTYAILYDVLDCIATRRWWFWSLLVGIDQVRTWLGSHRVLRVVQALAAAVAVYSIVLWLTGSDAPLGGVGSNLFASVVVFLLAAGGQTRA
jgi:hypothetical protein